MNIPDAAIGSIIAAAIAGLVVFISTVLSKEQKTSEFRQVWIDELRKDVAQYVSGTIEFAALYCHKKKTKDDEVKFLEENFAAIRELQSLEHRIILRLNPIKHASLVTKIKGFRSNIISLYQQGLNNKAMEATLTDALTDDCKEILKSEWERVKKGEPAFQFVKWSAIIIAAALGPFIMLYLLFSSSSNTVQSRAKSADQPLEINAPAPFPSVVNTNSQSVQVTIGSSIVPAEAPKPTRHTSGSVPKSAPGATDRQECNVVAAKCQAPR